VCCKQEVLEKMEEILLRYNKDKRGRGRSKTSMSLAASGIWKERNEMLKEGVGAVHF
jgi:hypothetical protein